MAGKSHHFQRHYPASGAAREKRARCEPITAIEVDLF